jgi:hypothetical protein
MDEEALPTTVDINYIKSSDFREIACDGAIGGPTPRGKLWLAFYTERLPLPRIVRHELKQASESGELTIDPNKPGAVIEGRVGVVRNVEFGLYLSIPTARELYDWLGSQIQEAGKAEGGRK